MKRLIITALLSVGVLTSFGQTSSELYDISNFNFTGITARSAGMGGAFTSLGADMSTMSINPAGMAMYSTAEIGMTMGLNIANAKTNYGGDNNMSDGNTRFVVPNIAGVFIDGNITIGVGINTIANYNSQSSSLGNAEQFNSRTRIWADQMNGISSDSYYDLNPVQWNALMAYDNYIVNPNSSDDYGVWGVVDYDDMIASRYTNTTTGNLTEFVVSMGYNLNNKFYFGGTLGVQSLTYNQSSLYRETNVVDEYTTGALDDLVLGNRLSLTGVGFNLKLGAIARPLPWLRVGVAYHSPTWLSVRETSYGDMEALFCDGTNNYASTIDLWQEYNMQTPSRLLTGISAAIGGIAIVSFDYEATWYNSMAYNSTINTYGWRESTLSNDIDNLPNTSQYTSRTGDIDLNGMINNYYRMVNNFKVGVEVMPVSQFYLRAGYNYSTSPYQDIASNYVDDALMSDYGAITRYTGGLGYRSGYFNIDLAYVYTGYTSLPSKYFDYVTTSSYDTGFNSSAGTPIIYGAGSAIASDEAIFQQNNYHNVLLTFSFRF